MDDRLTVARIGGVAGFGMAAGHLHADGTVALASLVAADRARIEALFTAPKAAPPHPDGFRYRLTRPGPDGLQTVEANEADVPAAVRACVRDRIG